MTIESDMAGRSFGSRLAFCASLVDALPARPIDVDERDAEIIKLAGDVLRDGLAHEEGYLKGLSAGLLPVIRISERRASETEEREYKPGNNYGFSGAVDTSSESYRYTARYLQALSAALSAEPSECANHFRAAMSLFALYSCDTDPKGAVRFALDEARDKAEEVIGAASRAAPAQWWTKYPWTGGQTFKEKGADVFVSFKNLDANGRETRDCLMAKTVSVYLREKGFSVFLSLDSLEQLGKSAYMEAIETALQDARVLIAVGTSADNLNSRWVKYEWHSFHQEIIEGYKKGGELFSVIDGLTERDLPLALRQRQAFRFSEDGLGALSRFLARSLGKETVDAQAARWKAELERLDLEVADRKGEYEPVKDLQPLILKTVKDLGKAIDRSDPSANRRREIETEIEECRRDMDYASPSGKKTLRALIVKAYAELDSLK